jgi:hypothetical protein
MRFWIVGLLAFLSGCDYSDQPITVFSISVPFSETDQEWTADFADYPENDSIAYELYADHDLLPENLNSTGEIMGLHISGKSTNRDLFMFIKGKISGLLPNTTYELLFTVKVASNTPSSVGENVKLKVGATLIEPRKELQAGVYRMNINKGNQAEGGSDMITIGNVVSTSTTGFAIITRTNSSKNDFTITTDETGEIWIVIGTESGIDGLTELFYTQVDVSFNQLN